VLASLSAIALFVLLLAGIAGRRRQLVRRGPVFARTPSPAGPYPAAAVNDLSRAPVPRRQV
jgi:hypothetical protein